MGIANVNLTDTFDQWRLKTNQIILYSNQLNEQQNLVFQTSNAAYNVANAVYMQSNTDNVRLTAAYNMSNANYVVTNSVYVSSNANYILTNSAFGRVNSVYDLANSNYGLTNAAFDVANAAFTAQNADFNMSNAAYTVANAAYTSGNANYTLTNAAFTQANTDNVRLSAAYVSHNAAYVVVNAAYTSINAGYVVVNAAYTYTNSSYVVANAAYTQANTARNRANDAYGLAQVLGGNTANLIIYLSDNWYATNAAFDTTNSAFGVANAAFNSANNVAPQVKPSFDTANAAFGVANASYVSINAGFTVANAAFAKANLAANNLANTATAANNYAGAMANSINAYTTATYVKLTSASQTITGDLSITGNLTFLGNSAVISSNQLVVGDSLIYLAANNYSGTDLLDIGFIANYGNTTGANVHTGLVRDATNKTYYLFNGYDQEPANNTFVPGTNNMVNAVLVADINTSNLTLGGANTIVWIKSAYDYANGVGTNTTAAFARANSVAAGANGYAVQVGAASNAWANVTFANATNGLLNSPTFTGTVDITGADFKNQILTDGSTISWNVSVGTVATVTLGGNRSLANPTNLKVGTYILHVIQDGTGGRTLTFGSAYKWPAGVAPILTTAASARDMFSFVSDGTNLYGSFLPDVR
jgi:hypothetical protein